MNNGRLKISIHIIVGQVVLCKPYIHRDKSPDYASENPGPMEDDGCGNNQANIGEVPGVIYTKEPTRDLFLNTDSVLQGKSFSTGRAVVRTVPVTPVTRLANKY